jgi:hypothetical protein
VIAQSARREIDSGCARRFVEVPRRPGGCIARPTREGYRCRISIEENVARRHLGGAGPDDLPGVITDSVRGVEQDQN